MGLFNKNVKYYNDGGKYIGEFNGEVIHFDLKKSSVSIAQYKNGELV